MVSEGPANAARHVAPRRATSRHVTPLHAPTRPTTQPTFVFHPTPPPPPLGPALLDELRAKICTSPAIASAAGMGGSLRPHQLKLPSMASNSSVAWLKEGDEVCCTVDPDAVAPSSTIEHSEVPTLSLAQYRAQHPCNEQCGYYAIVGKMSDAEEHQALLEVISIFGEDTADGAEATAAASAAAAATAATVALAASSSSSSLSLPAAVPARRAADTEAEEVCRARGTKRQRQEGAAPASDGRDSLLSVEQCIPQDMRRQPWLSSDQKLRPTVIDLSGPAVNADGELMASLLRTQVLYESALRIFKILYLKLPIHTCPHTNETVPNATLPAPRFPLFAPATTLPLPCASTHTRASSSFDSAARVERPSAHCMTPDAHSSRWTLPPRKRAEQRGSPATSGTRTG